MLAGRKLLLADDSITIQKIVALTFADEGIEVVAVSNGAEALEKLEEISPDVVLADVFMPRMNGYRVCEHIKQTEKLKHIPVMLLVGSFEPFDEAEARRVGADDTLTKPFQSIRNLVDKVGALLGREKVADGLEEDSLKATEATPLSEGSPASAKETEGQALAETRTDAALQEADTMELPPPQVVPPPEEPMSTAELEITTADTQPLSAEIRRHSERSEQYPSAQVPAVETVLKAETMHTNFHNEAGHEPSEGFGDTLLELDHFGPAHFLDSDDVVLDIDFDSAAPEILSSPAVQVQTAVTGEIWMESPDFISDFPPALPPTFVDDEVDQVKTAEWEIQDPESEFVDPAYVDEGAIPHLSSSEIKSETAPQVEQSQRSEQLASSVSASEDFKSERSHESPVSTPAGTVTLEQLSPEVVDAIARRAVAQLSEKAVEQIAWEVVPQLAELMIKRMLEEHESQNK